MDSFSYPIFFVILQCVIKTLNLTLIPQHYSLTLFISA